MKNNNKKYSYSCVECAEKLGAKPSGDCHTVHISKCELCGKQEALSHRNDWNWPGVEKSIFDWD